MPLGAWPIVVVLVDGANIVLFCVSCIMNDSVLGLFNTVSGQNKTVGGFGKSGATTHAVSVMTETVAPYGLKVKASGGIHNYDEAVAMVEAGASRIGASCGVEICK